MSWTTLALVSCVAVLAYLFGDQLWSWPRAGRTAGRGRLRPACWPGENRTAQRLREARALHQVLVHAEQLRAERARQRAVVEVLGSRVEALHRQLETSGRRVCALRQEVSTLRGNYEALRVELELQAVLESDARIVELGRSGQVIDPWVTARELWSRDESVRRLA